MDTRPWKKSEIAERFKALRRKAPLTQKRLGEIINLCPQSISEIENCRVMPHETTWERFRELEWKHNRPAIVMPTVWD
jgi:DNA-binding XRE family transcriptional regulator